MKYRSSRSSKEISRNIEIQNKLSLCEKLLTSTKAQLKLEETQNCKMLEVIQKSKIPNEDIEQEVSQRKKEFEIGIKKKEMMYKRLFKKAETTLSNYEPVHPMSTRANTGHEHIVHGSRLTTPHNTKKHQGRTLSIPYEHRIKV